MAAQRKRGARRGANRNSGAGGGWLKAYVAGLATGLFAAFMIYLATLPPEEGELPTAAPATASAAPQPSFDFYEVLPEQSIDVEVDPADLPQRNANRDAVYLLQAGSFRDAEDADRRRGELLLLGLEPRVEETQGSNGRWFRVVIGPFESRSAMARARSLTAQQDIDTLLVRRDGN